MNAVIFGSAILAVCMFLGYLLGGLVGALTGLNTNMGGVGFAVLIFIAATRYLIPPDKLKGDAARGIVFWKNMYIPVVVAMTASQDVARAVSSGVLAIVAGTAAVLAGVLLVPALNKIGARKDGEALK